MKYEINSILDNLIRLIEKMKNKEDVSLNEEVKSEGKKRNILINAFVEVQW